MTEVSQQFKEILIQSFKFSEAEAIRQLALIELLIVKKAFDDTKFCESIEQLTYITYVDYFDSLLVKSNFSQKELISHKVKSILAAN